MAIGVSKELTKIAVMEEVTEGTYVVPAADTDYVQPLSDGFEINGSKELKERNILTSGFNAARSRVGKKSLEWSLNVEARGSGVEGGQADFHLLLKSMMGGNRELAARATSSTGHTASVINFASTTGLNVGDIVCVLEAGAFHISPIITVTTDTSIELLVPGAGAFSDAVELAKFQTYLGSNDNADYPTLSLSYYHGDEILEKGLGARPNSLELANFTTGELAAFNFSGSGIDFDRIDGSAPHTPVFDSEVPPLILSACVYVDGAQLDVNNVALTIEHENGELNSTCQESGVIATRKTGKRGVSGSFDPFLDDSDVSLYDKFKDNSAFSLFGFAANPGAAAGEYDLGSIWAYYLPNCISSANVVGDEDNINIQNIEFNADGGEGGTENEVYLGFI